MSPWPASRLYALAQFLRTPTLGRSVVALLAAAILLLLLVNLTTYMMIQRTASFNDNVHDLYEMRRATRSVLIAQIDAERGQRGFLLTGQQGFLEPYFSDRDAVPVLLQEISAAAAGDTELEAAAEAMTRLSRDKFAEMDATLAYARSGQIGPAIQMVRGERGKALMEALRAEVTALDDLFSRRMAERRAASERSAFVTTAINALAGLLILVLAGIVLMLVRRYIGELNEARTDIVRINAGLEETVKARTAALTRANDEVQRFAYIVSHDLRSPLVNVMGYTAELEQAGRIINRQIARLETEDPDLIESDAVTAVRDDIPEALGFIRTSTEKMDRLINAILKLSREGRRNLAPERLDMTTMVGRIADSIRHQTEAAHAEILVEPLAALESDRLSIEQIFSNLIENAVKYLDPKRPGRIVVTGEDLPGGWVEYAVADSGRGISERDHERIFELFRRSGRQDRPGEGLGLAFVRNSVRRLGGSIEVESELGKGSTFRLKFPKRLILAEVGDVL